MDNKPNKHTAGTQDNDFDLFPPLHIEVHEHQFTIPVEYREYDKVEYKGGMLPRASKIEVTKLRCVCGEEASR